MADHVSVTDTCNLKKKTHEAAMRPIHKLRATMVCKIVETFFSKIAILLKKHDLMEIINNNIDSGPCSHSCSLLPL